MDTLEPLFGTISTSPEPASLESAERIGVLETLYLVQRLFSLISCPGLSLSINMSFSISEYIYCAVEIFTRPLSYRN